MSEFFLEVFTEEIPAKLQNDARNSLSNNFKKIIYILGIIMELMEMNYGEAMAIQLV